MKYICIPLLRHSSDRFYSSTVPRRFHVKHVDKIVANNLTDRRNKLIAYFNKFGTVKDMYLNEKFNAGLQQNLPLDYRVILKKLIFLLNFLTKLIFALIFWLFL